MQTCETILIGKAIKLQYFKNVKALPITYSANKIFWMTNFLFTDYLTNLDKSIKKQKRNLLLFSNKCPVHPPICNLKNVKVLFFPAYCISVLQLLDLDIPCSVKANYRKLLMKKVTAFLDKNMEKGYNVLDALYFVRQSWDQISKNKIKSVFRKWNFQG